jgi:thymidylate synthase (methanogen type)
MKHYKIKAFDIPDAWYKAVSKIWNEGEIFNVGHGSEDGETKKLDVTICISHPDKKPLLADKCPSDPKAVEEYALAYFVTDFLGEHPYTYGHRLQHPVNQLEKIIEAILSNPENRQLTMVIRIPEDVDNKEPPCLTMIDIEVYEGVLNLTAYFRSWDAYGAMNDNLIGLFFIMKYIVTEVNERSPYFTLKTGSMIIHSKNCHIYKRCYEFVKQLLKIDDKSIEEKNKRKSWVNILPKGTDKPFKWAGPAKEEILLPNEKT